MWPLLEMEKKMAGKTDDSGMSGLGDILKGFGKLLNNVIEMAETGASKKSSSGELFNSDNEHGLKGTYDFSVRMGLNDKDAPGVKRKVDIIVPQTDVFREQDRIIAILDMPDISLKNFSCRLLGNSLHIEGTGEKAVYDKTIDLGDFETTEDNISVSENNGIFKIVIIRK